MGDSKTPPGMVFVPAGNFTFISRGVEKEGLDVNGVDVQFPWESSPRREHAHNMTVAGHYGTPGTHAEWLSRMRDWRVACRKAINYTGAIYDVKELAWTQTS